MTNESSCKLLIEAIYAATQAGVGVTFSKDFSGQMTVTIGNRHTHAGVPQGKFMAMVGDATRFIDENLGPIIAERANARQDGACTSNLA